MKSAAALTLTLALLFSAVAGTPIVNLVSAQDFEAITIKTDGRIDPLTASITKIGNVYTLTGDILGSIIVEKFNIVLDGAGYTLQGNGAWSGIQIANNNIGTHFLCLPSYAYDGTNPLNMDKTIFYNNFVSNQQNVVNTIELFTLACANIWDNSLRGNYWSNYRGNDSDNDGIGDAEYIIDANNQDNYLLMASFDIDSVIVELHEWAYAASSPEPTTSPTPTPFQEPTSTPETQQPQPFPIALAIALIITITVEGIGLLIYFKKRKS